MKMKPKNQVTSVLALVCVSIGMASSALGETKNNSEWSDNFSDNNLDPFERLNPTNGHSMSVFSKRVKTKFLATAYKNNRVTRSIEAAAQLPIQKEGQWTLRFQLPKKGTGTRGNQRYPDNTIGAIAQIFQNEDATGCNGSHTAICDIEHNDLFVKIRSACNNNEMKFLIDDNISRSTWHTLQLRFRLSRNGTGYFYVKYNGSFVVVKDNINFGFGQWSGDTQTGNTFVTGIFGQYNHDHSWYYPNTIEQWTVYYDDVEWLKL